MSQTGHHQASTFEMYLRLAANLRELKSIYRRMSTKASISGAAEWLCDNYYMVEREGKLLLRQLKLMPRVPSTEDGHLIIYRLCSEYCSQKGAVTDIDDFEVFLTEAQHERPLGDRELDALPVMLKYIALEEAYKAVSGEDSESDRVMRISRAMKSLRFTGNFDFTDLLERQSAVEHILSTDPAGVYARMDEKSRSVYRTKITDQALRERISETEVAQKVVEMALLGKDEKTRHVGYYLFDRQKARYGRGRRFIKTQMVAAVLISTGLAVWRRKPLLAPALVLPVYEAIRPVFERMALTGVTPAVLPALALPEGIPEESPVLVTVSTLLPSVEKAPDAIRRLEQLYFIAGKGEVHFCLLADLPESDYFNPPQDAAAVGSLSRQIRNLNVRYGERFYLVVRPRTYLKTQGRFAGAERKRGAISALVEIIRGKEPQDLLCFTGNLEKLRRVKYLMALDSDTRLQLESLTVMTGTALHPLNKAVIPESGIIREGYGIFAPRIGTELKAAQRTLFARLMCGAGGVTAYDNACSDFYQDLFEEGIFAGKGLIDVEAFGRVMENAIPPERILSHDIIEGCMLRSAFLSDVEITDGFPARAGSWLDRLHRWVRGDFQNLIYLCPQLFGYRKSLPGLSMLSRYKISDNVRRALTPPVAAVLVLTAALIRDKKISRLLALAGLAPSLLPALFSTLMAIKSGGLSMLSRRYYSGVLPKATESLSDGALSLLMLPQIAYTCLDGLVRAAWRSFVSGRNLLEWTTAAESESSRDSLKSYLVRFAPSTTYSLVLLLASSSWLPRLIGGYTLMLLPAARFLSRPVEEITEEETADEKVDLYAAAMWKYYEDFVGEEDHYLPPDNVQESPVRAIAHRTSPTNIGLYLCSVAAAYDFKLIEEDQMLERISRTLDTLEALEQYSGHFYNWYDTCSLRPLRPRYVSTVDSGNLVCCLLALREALEEVPDSNQTESLCTRLNTLIDRTDFSILYNTRRRLFHIGYDLEKDQVENSYYDLLMSEARMTGYYAIAARVISKKHWGALGRTLARKDGFTGPVSWTGTMFEYFMPHLFLPVYKGSLGYEALKFCLHCQKKRVRKAGSHIPYGISESAFYSFDPQLAYQYKAHGIQKLALKRGLDEELVISPYSTFLTLPFDREAAVRNLDHLEEIGMFGEYGFYDAADFTQGRGEEDAPALIKNYMAHHIGMSFLALANYRMDNIWQQRFMRDHRMAAASELLEEKIECGAVVYGGVPKKDDIPQKNGRSNLIREEYTEISPASPRVHFLTNGEYSLLCTDSGTSLSLFGGVDLTRRSCDLLRRPSGIFALAEWNGGSHQITRAPDYKKAERYHVSFGQDSVEYSIGVGNCNAGMKALVHPYLACEKRVFFFSNETSKSVECRFLIYLEPSLSRPEEIDSHPAFSKLFLSVWQDSETEAMIFYRRPRGKEDGVCIAVGFLGDVDFEVETRRERLLTSPGGVSTLADAMDREFGNTSGLPDPALAIRFGMVCAGRSTQSRTLLIAAGSTPSEALDRLRRAAADGHKSTRRGAGMLAGGGIESRLASLALPNLLFMMRENKKIVSAIRENNGGPALLWGLGISGDHPILLIELQGEEEQGRVLPYIRMHGKLRASGLYFDLAVTYLEGGDYHRPVTNNLTETARRAGAGDLIGVSGGLHFINLISCIPESVTALRAAARYIAPYDASRSLPGHIRFVPAKLHEPKPLYAFGSPAVETLGGYFTEKSYVVKEGSVLPWCHAMSNPRFGTLVSNRTLGFTWAGNSRENKLTPWLNDTAADNRGEMLLCRVNGRIYDLINGAGVQFDQESAEYTAEMEGIQYKIRVFVPPQGAVKRISVDMTASTEQFVELAYYTEPVIGNQRTQARFVKARWEQGTLLLENPWNTSFPGVMAVGILGGAEGFNCDRAAFFNGRWHDQLLAPLGDPCAAVCKGFSLSGGQPQHLECMLGWAATADEAVSQLKNPPDGECPHTDELRIQTGNPAIDILFNEFLPAQILHARIWGRTGFYQNGGAWGFRDQLQDCCAALYFAPGVAREHLLRSASRQFTQGDVLHWWHEMGDGSFRGVRTRYSDDMLWLPFAVCEYVEKINDSGILDELIPFVDGDVLSPDETERYFEPSVSEERASLYEHCIRAIRQSARFGRNGLPLIGGGDWNDGFNQVGAFGDGESVWLAMFQIIVANRFIRICQSRGDAASAEWLTGMSGGLKAAIEARGWDGKWYLRAYYDSGCPMGSECCDECRIDLLPQSFAVLCGLADSSRVNTALDSAMERLVDEKNGVIKLFDPPFERSAENPGYIMTYPPGLRENGGQYTHAACWFIYALFVAGRVEDAWRLLMMINPAERSSSPRAEQYLVEPYAITADIYTNKSCLGRGGWSLYTGAAGWYYKAVAEAMLGLRIEGTRLWITPRLPAEMQGYRATLKRGDCQMWITVRRTGTPMLTQDGQQKQAADLLSGVTEVTVEF